jgi:hypothetical protein
MTSAAPGLVVEVHRDVEECVLAVSGELSLSPPGLLTRSVSKALADPGRVLVDVSGLERRPPAVARHPDEICADHGGHPHVGNAG